MYEKYKLSPISFRLIRTSPLAVECSAVYHRVGQCVILYSTAKFVVILCRFIQPEVLTPEDDLRLRHSIHTHNRDIQRCPQVTSPSSIFVQYDP
jgi:hypothetical protein